MQWNLWRLCASLRSLLAKEDGQDLIEYALVIALIAFAATAAMSNIANTINAEFNQIGGVIQAATA